MQEVWKDIKGFEGVYQISCCGRLKSFKSDVGGRILLNQNSKGDYLSVVLKDKKGTVKYTRMHRLVAETFMPLQSYSNMEVHHKDEDKQNNHIDNLEWIASNKHHKETLKNNPHMLNAMIKRNKSLSPPILQYSLDGELIAEYPSAVDASNVSGVCKRNIQQVANKSEYKPGKTRKQAGGFIWRLKRGDLNEVVCVG